VVVLMMMMMMIILVALGAGCCGDWSKVPAMAAGGACRSPRCRPVPLAAVHSIVAGGLDGLSVTRWREDEGEVRGDSVATGQRTRARLELLVGPQGAVGSHGHQHTTAPRVAGSLADRLCSRQRWAPRGVWR
jgi:hypothetical protein